MMIQVFTEHTQDVALLISQSELECSPKWDEPKLLALATDQILGAPITIGHEDVPLLFTGLYRYERFNRSFVHGQARFFFYLPHSSSF